MGWRLWFRGVLRRCEVERELEDELRFHLEEQIAENLAAGMSQKEARMAARRAIGGIAQIEEECRDARRTGWISDFGRDLAYAGRTLRRSPGFTAAVILTLALGIGANTAIFSIADAVLLRMLPVRQPEQLFQVLRPETYGRQAVSARALNAGYFDTFSFPNYQAMQQAARLVADLVAERATVTVPVSIAGSRGEKAARSEVSGNYFDVLGVRMALGRGFQPEFDNQPGQHAVAVISYRYWQQRFHGDPLVLGSTIAIGNAAFQLTGIADRGFSGLQVGTMADIWTPIAMFDARLLRNPYLTILHLIGRPKPGVDEARALAPMQVEFRREVEAGAGKWPSSTPPALRQKLLNQRLKAVPAGRGYSRLREQYGEPLRIVMAVVMLVLLVACGNVANLLLARAAVRRREMAVRLSLGAGRFRLIRQLLVESLLLAGAATAFGLAIAEWSVPLLIRLLAPAESPVQLAVGLDSRVLAFAAASALATAVLFGLFPALRAARVEIHSELKSGSRVSGGSGHRAGKLLVAGQLALSMVLVATSALFVRTLVNLNHLNTGFDRNVMIAFLHFEGNAAPEVLNRGWEAVRHNAEAIPGVEAASFSVGTPFSGAYGNGPLRLPGPPSRETPPGAWVYAVSQGYFRTLDAPVVMGRDFEERDFVRGAAPVVIISEATARAYFGNANPVGRKIGNFEQEDGEWAEVVGVARDMKYLDLRAPAPPIVYLPYTMTWGGSKFMTLEIRARRDTVSIASALRRAATAAGAGFSVGSIESETKLIDDSLIRERLLATLGSFFGGLALLLAAVGLYGIMSYMVARRTGEIGIRMALGAERVAVMRMVLREAAVLVIAGAATGIAAAYFAGRAIATLLFGLKPGDPATMVGAVLVLAAAALGAAAVPAWRASRTDPVIALREE